MAIFTRLFNESRETEMMDILHILYDVLGLQLSGDVELTIGHPEARQYFLFSFLLDLEDCMHGFINEPVISE